MMPRIEPLAERLPCGPVDCGGNPARREPRRFQGRPNIVKKAVSPLRSATAVHSVVARLKHERVFLTMIALMLAGQTFAAESTSVRDALRESPDWFRTAEGRQIVANVLSHQSPRGDWPKNVNTAAVQFTGDTASLRGTFDNGATTGELRLLARAYNASGDATMQAAFLRGLNHILVAQYSTGGWPQYAPPPATSYHRHITFNDGTMVRLLELLRDIATSDEFSFVESGLRTASRAAFDRGVGCIVKSQVRVNGELTVWCAQHDEVTLEPRPGRAFELVSLSGAESAGLLGLLMSVEKPSPAVINAVHAGVPWFEKVQIKGVRETLVDGDKRMIADPAAPPLWARFYEIGSNRPIYAGRDGIKRYDIAEIEAERRNGYAWHGRWGDDVSKRYQEWQAKWPSVQNSR